MRITMTMLVKNERGNVEQALDSFWDDVDAVVIADTGSTDGTKPALLKYAEARGEMEKLHLIDFEWVDDFAAARQYADDYALEHTKPDWLAWADADDSVEGMGELRRIAQDADSHVAAFFCLYEYGISDQGQVVCELWRERLVRAGKGRWTDRIHESQYIEGNVIQLPKEVARWVHRKPPYQPSDRNRLILEKWEKDEPRSWRVLSALAREHMVDRNWEKAIPIYERALRARGPSPDAQSQVVRQLSVALMQVGKAPYAVHLTQKDMVANPLWPDTHNTLAEIYGQGQRWQECVFEAENVLRLGQPDTVLIIDPQDYTLRPNALKALSYAGMGQLDEAIDLAERITSVAPDFFNLGEVKETWKAQRQLSQSAAQWAQSAELLLHYDEPLKAHRLLQTVPNYAETDPRVIAARVAAERALERPYTVEPLQAGTARGEFLLAGIRRQISERSAGHDWEQEPFYILDPSGAAKGLIEGNLEEPGRCRVHSWPRDGEYYDAICFYGDLDNLPDPEARIDHLTDNIALGGKVYVGVRQGRAPGGATEGRKRSWQQLDVAALMRRHGTLDEFGVDEEGFISGSMGAAQRRGEVAVYAGPALGPWHPMDIEDGEGLGGSETAAWRLAEGLSDQGYSVSLYGYFKQLGAVKDVILYDWRTFDPTVERKAVIVFRNAEPFDWPLRAEKRFLWLEDVAGAEGLTEERAGRLDYVCTVSASHTAELRESAPYLPESKILTSRNGIVLDFFDQNGDRPRREKRVLYTSSPDRGLDLLLAVWPEVLERVPDAELLHCYSRWWDHAADQQPKLARFRSQILEQTERLKGARKLPAQGQRDLAHLMQTALVWCLPSYNTPQGRPFNETNCIGVQEAQAAGCLAVTGDWGALSEMNRTGIRLPGDPSTDEWRANLVHAIVEGLTDPELQEIAQVEGPAFVADRGWGPVVAQLEALIGG